MERRWPLAGGRVRGGRTSSCPLVVGGVQVAMGAGWGLRQAWRPQQGSVDAGRGVTKAQGEEDWVRTCGLQGAGSAWWGRPREGPLQAISGS